MIWVKPEIPIGPSGQDHKREEQAELEGGKGFRSMRMKRQFDGEAIRLLSHNVRELSSHVPCTTLLDYIIL